MAMPLVVTLALLIGFDHLREFVWDHWAYALTADHVAILKEVLFIVAVAELIAMAALALSGYFKLNDYVATAARIDDHIGAHQEILTLATMTDPAHPETREGRSPLFPMLWRRTIAYFDLFAPRREFPLKPLRASWALVNFGWGWSHGARHWLGGHGQATNGDGPNRARPAQLGAYLGNAGRKSGESRPCGGSTWRQRRSGKSGASA